MFFIEHFSLGVCINRHFFWPYHLTLFYLMRVIVIGIFPQMSLGPEMLHHDRYTLRVIGS